MGIVQDHLVRGGTLIDVAFAAAATKTSPDLFVHEKYRGVVVYCDATKAGTLKTYRVGSDGTERLLYSDAVAADTTKIRDFPFIVPRLRVKFVGGADAGAVLVDAFPYGG